MDSENVTSIFPGRHRYRPKHHRKPRQMVLPTMLHPQRGRINAKKSKTASQSEKREKQLYPEMESFMFQMPMILRMATKAVMKMTSVLGPLCISLEANLAIYKIRLFFPKKKHTCSLVALHDWSL
jgi:hypothetical protein